MPNYDINYNDQRFTEVKNDERQALTDVEKTYGGMISDSDKYYQDQINASKQWENTQKQNQQAMTDFTIEKIEQNKEQAKKDYTKEQSGAYTDWQKQSNQYGANAEAMAANGLTNSGYSESSQVAMYNQYQQRVVAARESYQLAVQNYNNSITEARLQNNAVLAEIAYNALQQQLELSLQGFQYKNQFLIEKSNKELEVKNMYYNQWRDVLNQINTENALAEDVRQYNETLAEQQRQHNETLAQQAAQHKAEIAYKNSALAEERRQYNESMKLQQEKFNWQKSQANKSSSSGGSSGGSETTKSSGGNSSNTNKGGEIEQVDGSQKDDLKGNNSSSKEEPPIDWANAQSVFGAAHSEAWIWNEVEAGRAIAYEENGKIKFKKVFNNNLMSFGK